MQYVKNQIKQVHELKLNCYYQSVTFWGSYFLIWNAQHAFCVRFLWLCIVKKWKSSRQPFCPYGIHVNLS